MQLKIATKLSIYLCKSFKSYIHNNLHNNMPPKRQAVIKSKKEPVSKKAKTEQVASESKSDAENKNDATSFVSEAKTSSGEKWNMKFSSWNVNGVRAWVQKNCQSYITEEDPDVFCMQETKCDTASLPSAVKSFKGYKTYWLSGDKAGYSGTALFSKVEPINVTYGIGIKKHDTEGRVITAEFEKFYFITVYVPNAGQDLKRHGYRTKEWDIDFMAYIKKLDQSKPVILTGDLNVAHLEIDLANPKTNTKSAGFTPEERQGFSNLLSEGFIDTFRHVYPDKTGAYSWWSYRGNGRAKNVGWRLDYFVISERLKDSLCDSLIRSSVQGSDHCPVTLLLHI